MSLIPLTFGFDRWLYLREMSQLVDEACIRFRALPGSPVLYTASIWTDPDAACSAGGRCWRALLPLLHQVRAIAAERLRTLPLHEDAILATNSHEDWFHHQVPLR